MTAAAPRIWPWRMAWLLVLAAAVGLRLFCLDGPSPWEDDYLNLDRALLPLADMWAIQQWQGPADTIFDFQPPLSYALAHLALKLDVSTLAARLPSVLAGILVIPGLGLLGTRLLGRGAGLAAAALAAGLVFPIAFAQAVKAYSLLLCLSVWSMWLLTRAVDRNSWAAWAGYGAMAVAMVYAGYQGLPVLVVQAAWAGVAGVVLSRRQPGAGRARVWRGLAAFAGVALAMLPWLPAVVFLRGFLHDPGVRPWQGLDLDFAGRILSGLVGYGPEPMPVFTGLWTAAAVTGLVAARRRRLEVLLLLGWAGVSALALVASTSHLRPMLDSRHLVMVFPALVLFAGQGLVWTGARLGERLPWDVARRVGPAALAGLAGLGLLWPSLARYPDYYGRVMSLDREFFQWLAEGPGDVAAVEFHGYKRNTRRMAARWMLPGRFAEAGTFAGPGYRVRNDIDACYLADAPDRPRRPGLPVTEFTHMFTVTRVTRAGQASRAPVVMDPGADGTWRYDDDFTTDRFYTDALAADNMSLDDELGLLRPSRSSRPAWGAWAFEVAPGLALDAARLTVSAVLYKQNDAVPADSRLTVEAAGDDGQFVSLGVIDQTAFPLHDGRPVQARRNFFDEMGFYHDHVRETAVTFALDPRLAASGRLTVRLGYVPGRVEGFLGIDGLVLETGLSPRPSETPQASQAAGTTGGPPVETPLARQAGHLLRNVGAVPWRADEDGRVVGRFAFALPDFAFLATADGVAGGPQARQAFVDRHPGLAPVASLADAAGRTALEVYDPSLADPGLHLSAAAPWGRITGLSPAAPAPAAPDASPPAAPAAPVASKTPASVRLTGRIVSPSLSINGQPLAVPVIAPPGSRLTLTPGGTGRLFFAPDWTGPDNGREAMSYERDTARSKRLRGGLVCAGEAGCALAYTFVSALPMTELRLRVYPTVYANPCRKCEPNAVRVRLSTDGGATYRTIAVDAGGADCAWSPDGTYRIRRVAFDRPVTTAILALEMERGEQAGFVAPSWNVDAMTVEIDLDATSLPPVSLSGTEAEVTLIDGGDNDLTVFVRAGPWPISHRTDPAPQVFDPLALVH